MPLFGAIEGGGTKFVCAIGTQPDDLRDEQRFATTTPAETLGRCIEYFLAQPHQVDALGVACFGPVDLRERSPGYGCITSTPKPGWENAAIVGPLRDALGVPIGFDTDVNGAVLGEVRWGAARGLGTAIYVTVGTGIGGGALIGGQLAHGLVHPEMGHLLLPREPDDLGFSGACRFHGARCWEGVAAGSAIEKRWGARAETLAPDHPAWDLEARYLASGLASLVLVISPQRLILGGGVMLAGQLFPKVRAHLQTALAGYVKADELASGIDDYIVPPQLGQRAGIAGALALAEAAHARRKLTAR